MTASRYEDLIALLDREGAKYRVLEHPPEGRTERVSALRGHPVDAAAKAMIVRVKRGKDASRYVLAVIPGGSRVDLGRVSDLLGGTSVSFATPGEAESLAGSVVGTVLPFAFDARLELIVDPALLAAATLYFNAGRLDRSVALATEDYTRVARPRVESISERGSSKP